MSQLMKRLVGGTAELITVTGTLSGSGSLSIPPGAILVTLTGRGGTGGDSSWYDPGQPYIAPTGTTYNSAHGGTDYNGTLVPTCSDTPGSWGQTNVVNNGATPYAFISWDCPYFVQTSPGQPYIAPSSGGGIYSGASTTATLNGVTDTWAGGYGGVASTSTQTLASTGLGQTMTYSIGSGGTLSYSYSY